MKTKIYNEVVIDMSTGKTISEDFEYVNSHEVAQCKKAVKKVGSAIKTGLSAAGEAISHFTGTILSGIAKPFGAIPTLWGADKWWQDNPYSDNPWNMMFGNHPGDDADWETAQQQVGIMNQISGDYGSYKSDRNLASKNYMDSLTSMRDQMGNMSKYEQEVMNRNAQKGVSRGMENARTTQNAYVDQLKAQWDTQYANLDPTYKSYQTEHGEIAETSSDYLDRYRV